MDVFSQITKQVADIFRKMSLVQRTNLIMLTLVTAGLIVFASYWAGKPEYALLYSNLGQQDAASIVQKLDELKIEHKVEGNAVYVPSKAVYDARLQLASNGLPQGSGVGYEIFGKSNFAMTDYMQQLNYKRALEGELSRTISSLNGIRGCRVHLAIPKKGLFDEEQTKPTASVVLDMASSAGLSKAQVGGIVHLVSSSVEGLSPTSVSVIDSRGNLLYGSGDDGAGTGLSSSQFEAKKNVENYLEKKAESMLSTILGQGKVVVRVNAELNFEQVEKTQETYDPEGQVARQETRSEEKEKENSPAAGETKAEGAAAASSTGKNSEKSQEKVTTSYEISKTIARIVSPVGSIKRLNVAVVVEGTYKESAQDAKGTGKKAQTKKEYVARSADEKAMYKKLVMNAVGFNQARGDEIEVSDASFDTSLFETENVAMEGQQNKEFILSLSKQGGILLLFLLAFVFLHSLVKKFSLPSQPVARTASQATPAGGAYAAPAQAMQQRQDVSAGAHPREAHPLPAAQVRSEEDIKNIAAQEPEAVAAVVKEWLSE